MPLDPPEGWIDMEGFANLDPDQAVEEAHLQALRDALHAAPLPPLPQEVWEAMVARAVTADTADDAGGDAPDPPADDGFPEPEPHEWPQVGRPADSFDPTGPDWGAPAETPEYPAGDDQGVDPAGG
ncbi:MAG TPA: hypothetical protein VIL46_14215 [Gemmataceae bacterium]